MSTSHSSNEDLKNTKLFDVSHLKTLVTGGGTGIGLMITQALCANGATVYITGRREDALNKVVEQYSTRPGKIIALPGDITKKEECLRLASEMSSKESNGIHLLVNNAGIARDDPTKYSNNEPDFKSAAPISSHLLKSEFSNFQETFETNITAHYFMTAAFVPLLAQGHAVTPGYTSSIVNITSISGVMKGSSAGQFAYAASKAGMMHLSRMLATTLKDCGIRVNQIAPGVFPSEMTTGESDEQQKSEIKVTSSNPAGRPGSDTDMGACILFLAGPGGLFMNNQILYPEGGNLLVAPAAT
jgi:NAD(P)-dependent dehydrogenase (short-subunit alcohol dehydrogenase family)